MQWYACINAESWSAWSLVEQEQISDWTYFLFNKEVLCLLCTHYSLDWQLTNSFLVSTWLKKTDNILRQKSTYYLDINTNSMVCTTWYQVQALGIKGERKKGNNRRKIKEPESKRLRGEQEQLHLARKASVHHHCPCTNGHTHHWGAYPCQGRWISPSWPPQVNDSHRWIMVGLN